MESMPKMKQSYLNRLDQVPSMMKTRQDNDVTGHIDVVYIENKTELLSPIRPSLVCEEN